MWVFFVSEFTEERRVLLENVGPELHAQFDMSGVEVSERRRHNSEKRRDVTR